jgi:outer membrane protein assembly factor BamB
MPLLSTTIQVQAPGCCVSVGADGLVVGSDAGTGQQKWTIDVDEAEIWGICRQSR